MVQVLAVKVPILFYFVLFLSFIPGQTILSLVRQLIIYYEPDELRANNCLSHFLRSFNIYSNYMESCMLSYKYWTQLLYLGHEFLLFFSFNTQQPPSKRRWRNSQFIIIIWGSYILYIDFNAHKTYMYVWKVFLNSFMIHEM